MIETDIELLKGIANQLRIHSITATTAAGSGHPTSCCSAADLVSALFFGHMKYDAKNPHFYNNDRFILSKGHAAPLLYAAWAENGFVPISELAKLRQFGNDLEGHPICIFTTTTASFFPKATPRRCFTRLGRKMVLCRSANSRNSASSATTSKVIRSAFLQQRPLHSFQRPRRAAALRGLGGKWFCADQRTRETPPVRQRPRRSSHAAPRVR